MATQKVGLLVLSLGLLTSIIGCGGKGGPPGPATVPVSGIVKHKGAALGGATVTFHPVAKDGRTAVAKTTDAGDFQLTTIKDNDGAIEGDYRVTVTKVIDENAPAAAPGAQHDMAAPARPPKYKSLIPDRYGSPDKSGLTATVKKGGPKVELSLTE